MNNVEIEMKKVSIIVPVFNTEKYIDQCINSLVNQTYSNIEIILVDDGSSDHSSEICDTYGKNDSRIRVIHKINGGLSDARNVGLSYAKGDYIGFVDSDDWVEPEMFLDLVQCLESNNADIVSCGLFRDYINKAEEETRVCKEGKYSSDEALAKLLAGVELHDHAVTKLYKKHLWADISFPVGKLYEDIRTIYKVFINAQSIYVRNVAHYHYRQREGSLIRNGFSSSKLEWLEALDDIASDPRICKRKEYISILISRKAVAKCKILRELFLFTPKKLSVRDNAIASSLFADIKKNRKTIIQNPDCSKSMRIMVRSSFWGYEITKRVFKTNLLHYYMLSRTQYYR